MAAFYVVRGGDKWLFDCGEGTQRQLWAATGGLPDIDGIFLTHFHADHTLGLPGIVSTMSMYGRKRPLSIYGPPGLREALQNHVALMPKKARGLLRWCETEPGKTHGNSRPVLAAKMDEYAIRSFRVKHAHGRAQGYIIQENERPGKIDASLCHAAGLTGPEMGRVKAGETVKGVSPADVIGPRTRGRKVVITGDTAPCPEIVMAADGADLLIHDATFLEGQEPDADHSTAHEAAVTATAAKVKRLACVHLANRNTRKATEAEACKVYSNAIVPPDLHVEIL